MLLLFGSDRIESDGTEFNNNLRLVATVDDVDETWEEPPGGSVAATMTPVVDAIYPTDTDVDDDNDNKMNVNDVNNDNDDVNNNGTERHL